MKIRVEWELDGLSMKAAGVTRKIEVPQNVLADFVENYVLEPQEPLTIGNDGIVIPLEYVADCLSDWISDEYGWLHNGWSVVP